MVTNPCPICKQPSMFGRWDKIYCSNACRQEAYRRRKARTLALLAAQTANAKAKRRRRAKARAAKPARSARARGVSTAGPPS